MPVSVIGLGAVPELLVNATEPLEAPPAVGAKTTEPAALPPAAIVRGKVNPVTVYPVPVGVIAVTVSDAVPVFCRVRLFVLELPVFTFPNAIDVGETVSCG